MPTKIFPSSGPFMVDEKKNMHIDMSTFLSKKILAYIELFVQYLPRRHVSVLSGAGYKIKIGLAWKASVRENSKVESNVN